jgi:hypothetical protein
MYVYTQHLRGGQGDDEDSCASTPPLLGHHTHLKISEMGQPPLVSWQTASLAAHAGSNCKAATPRSHMCTLFPSTADAVMK